MNNNPFDQGTVAQELADQADAFIDPLMAIARNKDPVAFAIAALAVMKAHSEGHPVFAVWLGSMLIEEGKRALQLGEVIGSEGQSPQAMATASIH